MTDAAQAKAEPVNRLEHYPVPLFGMVMGIAGLTLAMHAGEAAFGMGPQISTGLYLFTFVLFGLITAGYVAKAAIYPGAVVAEWKHPVRLLFFPAISISLLLLATATMPRNAGLAEGMWLLGMALQFVLTIAVVTSWIGTRSFQHGMLNPAWFIPAVGNVIVPVAGVPFGYVEISWYFMSVGLIFWLVLLTLVINRLIFHDPLPGRLQPTLVILIAPPAVAFVAWLHLTGEVDAFARILINGAYFFTVIVLVQLPRILRLDFTLSFWALSFPFAAATIASFRFAELTGSGAHRLVGGGLLIALCVIIMGLLWRTVRAALAGRICVPE
ncbi:C4-dicarboxylate ABC transporter [Aquicoccus porphyridii]|uniref:C4-dicarboxylate ABC transporter n=2 Tax=Aquicoccus porphyridii TaxID=1852029 RepID=A0A5A9ZGI7_9RHOB|nr:C4-dicarboxylate ABC transporter [Aquicoccus porphyridii]RAI53692.1 C4-dicarboxylate ABC transporter [Rhodobacteraceae bacterium AsT-22]